jgi:hypothetical protein
VVGLAYLGRWIDREFEFGLFAVINAESFHEKTGESRSGAAPERMEHQKALESGALVCELTQTVQDDINDLFADGVVTASVIVGSIFFASDELFRMEELSVCTGPYFICENAIKSNASQICGG